jgi:hypothetical protein
MDLKGNLMPRQRLFVGLNHTDPVAPGRPGRPNGSGSIMICTRVRNNAGT